MGRKVYNSNYLGIVINNNDPQQRGRVQIFIPHVMPALYKGWNEDGKDIQISCVGDNVANGLTSDIVDRLVKILPWAESASPIMTMSSPGQVRQGSGVVSDIAAGAVGVIAGAVAGPAAGAAASAATKRLFDQSPTAHVKDNTTVGGGVGQLLAKAGAANGVNYSKTNPGYMCARGVSGITRAAGLVSQGDGVSAGFVYAGDLSVGGSLYGQTTGAHGTNPYTTGIGAQNYQPGRAVANPAANPQFGDTVYGSSASGGAGHAQMYLGLDQSGKQIWVSDFTQSGFSPNFQNYAVYSLTPEGRQKLMAAVGADPGATDATSTTTSPSAASFGKTAMSGEKAAASPLNDAAGPPPDPNGNSQNAADPNAAVQVTGGMSSALKDVAARALAGGNVTRAVGDNVSMDLNGSPNSVALEGGPLTHSVTKGGVTIAAGTKVGDTATSFKFSDGSYANGATDMFIAVPAAYVGKPFAVQNNKTGATTIAYGMDAGGVLNRGYTETSAATQVAIGLPSYAIGRNGVAITQGNPDISVAPITDGSLPTLISRDEYNKLIGNPLTADQQAALEAQQYGNATPEQIALLKTQAAGSASGATHTVNSPDRNGVTVTKDVNDMAKGMFAYPAAGAMVWVFFREGNPLYPVYFAASYSQAEWKSVYRGSSPSEGGYNPVAEDGKPSSIGSTCNFGTGGFSSLMNHSDSDPNQNQSSFMVFGEDGSNMFMGKGYHQLFSKFDRRDQVEGDRHDTTLGFKETWVQGDHNKVVMGDQFIKIGNCSQEAVDAVQKIQQYIKEIQEPLTKSN